MIKFLHTASSPAFPNAGLVREELLTWGYASSNVGSKAPHPNVWLEHRPAEGGHLTTFLFSSLTLLSKSYVPRHRRG
jgi:hypothetical protein